MKHIITTIFLSYIFSLGFSQQNNVEFTGDMLTVNTFNDSYNKINGSPYVNEKFQMALFAHNNKKYLIRYDAYKEVMQVKVNGDEIRNLHPQKKYIITTSEEKKKYVVTRYPDSITGFGILIWSNATGKQLLKREKIKMNDAKVEKAYQSAQPPTFTEVNEIYYFKDLDKKLITELPNSKNKIFSEIFDNKFKSVAKEEGLNPKNEADLIKLFEIYFK